MFAPEGYLIIAAACVLGAALAVGGSFVSAPWAYLLFVAAAGLVAFTLYFFRDPRRTPPAEAIEGRLLLAPADGKIVAAGVDVDDPLYIKGPAKRISIFLSPLNVHVNRVPADGVVEYENYVPGDYLVAWHPKAHEKNERSEIGLRHPSGTKVVFKQIAGAMARRIVYHLGVGDEVKAGDRFGIVKFGSRMDVLVPPHVEIDVQEGQCVKAGLTVLGRLPEASSPNSARQHSTRKEVSS